MPKPKTSGAAPLLDPWVIDEQERIRQEEEEQNERNRPRLEIQISDPKDGPDEDEGRKRPKKPPAGSDRGVTEIHYFK